MLHLLAMGIGTDFSDPSAIYIGSEHLGANVKKIALGQYMNNEAKPDRSKVSHPGRLKVQLK